MAEPATVGLADRMLARLDDDRPPPVLLKDAANPILSAVGDWDRLGIRDPVVMTDPAGRPTDEREPVIFFNGRDRPLAEGGLTRVGREIWTGGTGWRRGGAFVFEDGTYAAAGSAVKISGDSHLLFYSHGTAAGLAVAESVDGWQWKCRRKPILQPEQFGATTMGLPHVVRGQDSWLMVFEGNSKGRFAIYGAASADALEWQPLQREPIYQPPPGGWDQRAQANPSLHIASDGRAVLLYNGCSAPNGWDVGALIADEPHRCHWRSLPAPLVSRGVAGSWDAGRVEGARPLCHPAELSRLGLLYFGLPGADSYAGGAIGVAWFE